MLCCGVVDGFGTSVMVFCKYAVGVNLVGVRLWWVLLGWFF